MMRSILRSDLMIIKTPQNVTWCLPYGMASALIVIGVSM